MIDHTGINVSSLARSREFYESVLATLGYGVRRALEDAVGFGAREPQPGDDPHGDFWISEGPPFTPRCHMAFRATSEAQVQAFHRAALAAGGQDNGTPGLRTRYHPRYYAAFVLDPDCYNVEAVFHESGPGAAAV